jgi:mannosyltransferase OCH1-like enzyme
MVTSSSSKNHRLDNNDRRSGGGTSSHSSIRHSNRNKNTNSKDTTQGGSSSSTVLLVWMILIGCIIFGFISSLFFNTFDLNLNNIQSVYDDAPSLMSLIQQQQQQQHPSIKSKSKSLVVLNSHHQQLSELTRSHVQNIECPERLFPFYDRIINTNEQQEPEEQHYLIPKSIHLSWKTRCVPQDMMEIIDKWKEQFPSYNIYFHDDVAVNALLNDDSWYDIFPHFKHIMNSCVKFGSAMTIDLWRILILYRYGGT